ISFFIHSTEDEEQLMKLVRDRLGLDPPEISEEKIIGHFGNEILSVKAHVIGPRAQSIAGQILRQLSSAARASIRGEMEKSLDEHDSLYFRLDRQSLHEPLISLSDEEPIRIKLKPKSRSGGRKAMKAEYEELFS
ncbi:MAG TPA: RNA-binding domain-containing protein, partial [Nitrososphaerales archaeon]|nr:RNA-binding domain-containing protein [Nitrososphaerales archaeon]